MRVWMVHLEKGTTMMHASRAGNGGTALRGALAAGTATALLLGGFGAFALWNESQNAGASGQIQTGQLSLEPIEGPVTWVLENPQDGGPAYVVDLATFRASPGDVLSYKVPAIGKVTGSAITAVLEVNLDDVVIDPSLDPSDVTVSVKTASDSPLTVIGTEMGAEFEENVTVSVTFSKDLEGAMNLPAAVDVDGLELVLQQQ